MDKISYPYLPSDRAFRFVPGDHPFMRLAQEARELCSGDPLFLVGVVLVRDGVVLARAGNGYNRGTGTVHVCPRIVLECPSGTGYDLCDLHDASGHAEPMLMAAAKEQGIDPLGCDVYLYGHWWCCEPCWKVMIAHGIRDVYLVENAHVEFARERVYAQTLMPKSKSVYISGGLTNLPEDIKPVQKKFYEALASAATKLGLTAYVPHLVSDPDTHPDITPQAVYEMDEARVRAHDVLVAEATYPSLGTGGEIVLAQKAGKPVVLVSKKGAHVSHFVRGNPAVVYHIEYDGVEDACRMLKNVLRQL